MPLSSLSSNTSVDFKALDRIPAFTGIPRNLRVQDFFREAERVAALVGWNGEQKKKYFSERFSSLAASYQDEINEDPIKRYWTYDEWKNDIMDRFIDKSETAYFKRELESARQMEGERVQDFNARINDLFRKA